MPTEHVAVRLRPDLIARVDALAPLLSTRWHKARRSDALRALLIIALESVDADRAILTAQPAGRGAAPGPGGPTEHVAVRLRVDLVASIDALAPLLSTRGHDARRSDVLRALLMIALESIDAAPAILTTPPGEPCAAPGP